MNRLHRMIALSAAVLALFPGPATACDFCLLSQGISPLDTIKGSGIKISERYTLLDRMYQGTTSTDNPGIKEEHWTTELTGFYSISPEFMVLATLPYRKGRTTGELSTDGTLDSAGAGRSAGMGDVSLMGRYTFLKHENPETTDVLAGLAGIKFPTGKTDKMTADNADYLDSHLQPGTGSTDYLLGLSFTHSLNRLSLSANLLGTIPGKGKFGNTTHQFGNALNYDISGKYRMLPEAFEPQQPQIFASLGLSGEAREKEKTDNTVDPDSGGNTVYLTPGLQLVLAPHWVVEISYLHAVYHRLNGTQLGETFKVVSGVTYLF